MDYQVVQSLRRLQIPQLSDGVCRLRHIEGQNDQ